MALRHQRAGSAARPCCRSILQRLLAPARRGPRSRRMPCCRSILQQEPPQSLRSSGTNGQQRGRPAQDQVVHSGKDGQQRGRPAQDQLVHTTAALERLLDPEGWLAAALRPPPGAGSPFADPGAGNVHYFAFGANMAFSTLAKRGARVLTRDPAVVADAGVRLSFQHRGGFATLQRAPRPAEHGASSPYSSSSTSSAAAAAAPRPQGAASGGGGQPGLFPTYRSHVHGVLYKLPRAEMDKLCKREGGYTLQDMEVITYDGQRVMAKVFVSSPLATLAAEVRPTERYARLLREGAADNYLDPLYQAWLSSIETVPSAGLPPHYYDTPSRHIATGLVLAVAAAAAAAGSVFAQHL